jgi:hypothetical protein
LKSAIFRPAAAADIDEAFRWYEVQRVGLGEEFLAEVDATLRKVLVSPRQYPVIHRSTRRALLRRFPYGLFYRVLGTASSSSDAFTAVGIRESGAHVGDPREATVEFGETWGRRSPLFLIYAAMSAGGASGV